MQALWIVLTVLLGGVGGWPVTAGILRLAKSADSAEAAGRDGSSSDGTAGTSGGAAAQRAAEGAAERAADPAAGPAAGSPDAAGQPRASPESSASPASSEVTSTSVLRGGLVIGFLERIAVVLAILADQPVAIAYIVAIKGLGRYPELKQTPAASERFIIGTLSSMLWAAGLATLVKWLLLG